MSVPKTRLRQQKDAPWVLLLKTRFTLSLSRLPTLSRIEKEETDNGWGNWGVNITCRFEIA